MADYFKTQANMGNEIHCELKDIFSKYTNDGIVTCAFGIRINSFSDENNEFFKAGKKFTNISTPINGIKFFSYVQCHRL